MYNFDDKIWILNWIFSVYSVMCSSFKHADLVLKKCIIIINVENSFAVLCFLWELIHFFWWREIAFTHNFDQLNASLLNKSINLVIKKEEWVLLTLKILQHLKKQWFKMARKKRKHSNNDSTGLLYLITNLTHLVTHLIMLFFCCCFGCQRNNISVCNASCHQASWLNMSLKQKKKASVSSTAWRNSHSQPKAFKKAWHEA